MCNLLKIRCVYGASRKNFSPKNLALGYLGSNFALAKTKKHSNYNYEEIIDMCDDCSGIGGMLQGGW